MMTPDDLRLCRTLLFLPASNARAIEKARTLDADMVVLDLEDAVRPEEKEAARERAIDAVAEGFGSRLVAVRINQVGSPYFEDDVMTMRRSAAHYIVLPKTESASDVADAASLTGKPVLAMIETPKAVIDAVQIAAAGQGVIAGVNDLGAELGIVPGRGREGLAYALQRIVLSARAAGVAAFDGVYNLLADDEGLADECRQGRAFGFDGKSLIHPSQIATANRLFGPSEDELAAARRLITAASGGAERFEGRMIEQMHVDQARAALAKARGG